ncbi:uncharacterized protein LOC142591284 isoform X2 [Dermacentor variabilis]|uniref:uncharacterized protein LOC142591284 isoform X2 n=1 Tax=Dermacentor variabilis TaxID=34621 RepID=UPI003F5B6E98
MADACANNMSGASGSNVELASDSVVERFIEAIKQHPCVYDTKRLDFRDQQRKENAWEQIRHSSGLSTVEECHKLWKKLRDRFTRELKAIELATRSGSAYVARQTWEFADAMSFYKNCGRPRKTTCNVGSGAVPRGDDSASTAEEIFNAIQGNSSAPSPIANADDLEPAAASPGQPAAQEDFAVSEPPSKRSKKGRSCDYFEEQLLSQLGKHTTENEAFGQSIAMSLDRMPTRIASRFKVKIMELLAEFDQYEA